MYVRDWVAARYWCTDPCYFRIFDVSSHWDNVSDQSDFGPYMVLETGR